MPRYEVLKDYRSGGHGPWEQGSKIELTEEEATWVNRDSSDTLKEIPGLGEEGKPALQARASELGLPTSGTKDELAARIGEAEAAGAAPAPAGEESASERQAGSQGAMTTADHPGITRPASSSRSSNRRRG